MFIAYAIIIILIAVLCAYEKAYLQSNFNGVIMCMLRQASINESAGHFTRHP